MKKINNKFGVLILAIILTIISTFCILINGKTYTVKLDVFSHVDSIDELNIEIEQDSDIVQLKEKSLEDDVLMMTFASVSEGKAYVDVTEVNGYTSQMFALYVHKFGIITYDSYFGACTYGEMISVSILILLAYIFYLLTKRYIQSMKANMYQYKNIFYLALLIFLFSAVLIQLFPIVQRSYGGIDEIINNVLFLTANFSIVLLPIAFITSIFVTISNIVLVKKEGFSFRNILGVILGIVFCFAPFVPDMLYGTLRNLQWDYFFRESSIVRYIENFAEITIYTGVAYLECILLGTIILGIKSAKHIPNFDKDYVIILGCQIRKDGTLTNLLKSRVDRAIEFSKMQKDKTGKDIIFVPSGGQGNDEVISEADAMKNYLLEKGIKEESILVENQSKNTFENIKFSKKLIQKKCKDANIVFSTTNYHVFRGGVIATNQDVKIEGIGAKTKAYFWINAFIREFIATLVSEKKKHIAILCGIMLIAMLMIVVLFLSYII